MRDLASWMLSIGKIAAGHASPAYYVDQVADGREDYYTGAGEAQGQWHGQGAADSGLHGEVDTDAFLAMLAPKTAQQSVMGYDLTFSAPKSVSILYGVGDSELSGKVRDAHDFAVEQALGYLERHATWTRRGHAGKQLVQGDRLTAALFRHRSSRAGDPQLHTHTVIANHTTAQNKSSALDGRALYAHAKTAGYLYQAALRAHLTENLGVAFEPVVKGAAEISGIAPAVLEHFSQRSFEVAEHLQRTGGRTRRAKEIAKLETRRAKTREIPADRLHEQWRARAQEHGLGRLELEALLDARAPGPAVQPNLAAHARYLASPLGLTHHRSTFDRRHVLQAWAEAHREGATPQRLEQLADRWLASPDAIAVEPPSSREITGRRHSTPELLATERELLHTARQRVGEGAGLATAAALERTFGHYGGLSEEQRVGVERLTGSGDGVAVVRAAAGTGKTRMLGAARHAWDAAGYRTIGCALSARAAFELEAEAGIDSTTIARLRVDLDAGSAIASDVVIVVDEAGMVGTRDLAHLSRHATRGGAKLVLVGDDRQLPEIEAGGAFRALATQLEAVELHDVRRQSDAWDRDALAALRHGRISEWADSYREHGRLVARPTAPEARNALVADWWQAAREPDTDALMLAHRRADVADLNRRARALAATDGRLGAEELHAAGRAYAAGDQVLARRNDRQLGVINGARGVVSSVDLEQRRVDVDFDRAGPVSLDARYLDDGQLDYGYAMTAHAAQGLTVDKTFVLGTDDLYQEWGYTALTRHKQEARFYAVSTGSIERCLPGLEPDDDPLTQDIQTALGNSRRQDLAGADANDLAIERLRAILAAPPPNLEHRIGPYPANPLDRDQWAAAAATLIRTPDWTPAPIPAPALDLEPALDLGP